MTVPRTGEDCALDLPVGETLSVSERVIVAPAVGVFHRLSGDDQAKDGDPIDRGDVVGMVQSLGTSTPVQSPFEGLLVAILALDGERVRPGQPVAWVRIP
jgi:acetyl-CoA carboxylase biotin carboxyl carrier protein